MRGVVRLVAAAAAVLVGVLAAPSLASADAVREAQWHLRFLKIDEVHRITRGDDVVVAIVDTGVDASHPDLRGATIAGTDLVEPGGDGRKDSAGHGTAIAGIIAARGREPGAGALGIAPRATILPVRAARARELGLPATNARAIEWAVAHGAKVICVAGGSSANAFKDAIAAASQADVVVVAGVGNAPGSTRVIYPAAIPGVLAAAGVDKSGNHAPVSITGPEVVLAAPAVDIVSTGSFGTYDKGTGTSDATAILAGAAALVRAKFPDLTAPEVIHRLTYTATDKGPPGRDNEYGYGVVDLVKALTAEVPPLTASSSPPSAAAPPNDNAPMSPAVLVGVLVGVLLVAGVAAGGIVYAVRRRPGA